MFWQYELTSWASGTVHPSGATVARLASQKGANSSVAEAVGTDLVGAAVGVAVCVGLTVGVGI